MDFSFQMFRDIPKLVSQHWKEGNFNWPMIVYISLVHIVAVIGLLTVPKASRDTAVGIYTLADKVRCTMQSGLCVFIITDKGSSFFGYLLLT